jgi:hypothetical protein
MSVNLTQPSQCKILIIYLSLYNKILIKVNERFIRWHLLVESVILLARKDGKRNSSTTKWLAEKFSVVKVEKFSIICRFLTLFQSNTKTSKALRSYNMCQSWNISISSICQDKYCTKYTTTTSISPIYHVNLCWEYHCLSRAKPVFW